MKSATSVNILLWIIFAIICFHVAVMAGVIPYNIAWGGRLQGVSEMYVFEGVSILVNLFLALILLMKVNRVSWKFNDKVVTVFLWVFLVLFILNTIGNLFAKTAIEKSFAVLTFVLAFLIWRLLRAGSKRTSPDPRSQ